MGRAWAQGEQPNSIRNSIENNCLFGTRRVREMPSRMVPQRHAEREAADVSYAVHELL
jgi:hypothetical protein